MQYHAFQLISNLYLKQINYFFFKNLCFSRCPCHTFFHCVTVKTHGHPVWITTAYTPLA